jgi:hypothetical protein
MSNKPTIAETVRPMWQLKDRGENAEWYGTRAADMTRDELLMFIGALCDTLNGQARQLSQAAKNIEALTAQLAEANARAEGAKKHAQQRELDIDQICEVLGFGDDHAARRSPIASAQQIAAKMTTMKEPLELKQLAIDQFRQSARSAIQNAEQAEARAEAMRAALSAIAEWPFDIRGDCVADARKLAQAALTPATPQVSKKEFLVYIGGSHPVAGFPDRDEAVEWAEKHYPGRHEIKETPQPSAEDSCRECGGPLIYAVHIERTGETKQEIVVTGGTCLYCGVRQPSAEAEEREENNAT